jgi:transposase-like protein
MEKLMTDRELLKQALYLIDAWERGAYAEEYPTEIEALRQALAQKQTKCPRCGEVNPAEIHTCSPQVAQEHQP